MNSFLEVHYSGFFFLWEESIFLLCTCTDLTIRFFYVIKSSILVPAYTQIQPHSLVQQHKQQQFVIDPADPGFPEDPGPATANCLHPATPADYLSGPPFSQPARPYPCAAQTHLSPPTHYTQSAGNHLSLNHQPTCSPLQPEPSQSPASTTHSH